jgi:HAD superfamily hydrolase (TIGR01549 family)
MIQGIIFDLGWTLMYLDSTWAPVTKAAYQRLIEYLNEQGLIVGEEFAMQFHAARERGWKLADESGVEQRAEDALRETLANLGHASLDGLVPRATRVFFQAIEPHWKPYSDALTTVQELSRRGLRVGLISNADDVDLVHNQVKYMGFAPYLSPTLSSAEEPRWRKPDPRIYHLVSNAWKIAPSEIVMVGDSPMYDIVGAHRAGMRSILIDHEENFAWQKIPDQHKDNPLYRADVTVKTLAEIPNIISTL